MAYERLKFTEIIDFDGKTTYGVWRLPRYIREGTTGVIYHTVESGEEGRPSAIALRYYGSTLLDWVIVSYNNAVDVLNWPKAGDIIQIPPASTVLWESA